jgi:putative oxidoreductase
MEYTNLLFWSGRLLFGGYWLMNAWTHFSKSEMLSGYAASKGVPMPKLSVFGTGALMALGGLGMLSGLYVKWAVLALVLFLVPVTAMMHRYWKETDPNMQMTQMLFFMRNIALLGASLMMLAIPEPWANPWS